MRSNTFVVKAGLMLMVAGGVQGLAVAQSGEGVRFRALALHDQVLPNLGSGVLADLSPALQGSLNLPQVGADGTVVYQVPFNPAAGAAFPELATIVRRPDGSEFVVMRSDRALSIAGAGSVTWLSGGRTIGALSEPGMVYLRIAGEGITTANDDLLGRLTGEGQIQVVAREGDVAAGLGAGVLFGEIGTPFTREPYYVNAAGDVVFWAPVSGTGVTTANNSAVWLAQAGSAPELVLRQGDVVGSGGGVIDRLDAPAINDLGEVAVRGRVRLADQSTLTYVWTKRPGEGLVVRFVSGSLVEGGLAGERYFLNSYGIGLSTAAIGQSLALSDQGRVVAWGFVQSTGQPGASALLSNTDAGGMRVVMRNGQVVAPGFSLSLSSNAGAPMLTDTGHVLALVSVRPVQGASVPGLVTHHPQAGLRLVARSGQEAPGLPAGQVLGGDFRGLAINEFGDVMFTTNITGTGVGAFTRSWWLATAGGELVLLARGGEETQVVLGDGTTVGGEVRGMDVFEPDATSAGTRSTLNERGEFAGMLHFANDTTAVVLGSVSICRVDVAGEGAAVGRDGVLDNNDFVVFIQSFFDQHPRADLGSEGAARVPDGVFDNNDFVVFIQGFFEGCL